MSELENKILKTIEVSLSESVVKQLTAYNSPMVELVKSVFNNNQSDYFSFINYQRG